MLYQLWTRDKDSFMIISWRSLKRRETNKWILHLMAASLGSLSTTNNQWIKPAVNPKSSSSGSKERPRIRHDPNLVTSRSISKTTIENYWRKAMLIIWKVRMKLFKEWLTELASQLSKRMNSRTICLFRHLERTRSLLETRPKLWDQCVAILNQESLAQKWSSQMIHYSRKKWEMLIKINKINRIRAYYQSYHQQGKD